jgi:tetratricopeptide (TPR) repeat protein
MICRVSILFRPGQRRMVHEWEYGLPPDRQQHGGTMAKKKRVTRKQLLKEPDNFISFTGKMIQFGKKYHRHMASAVGVLIIALLTFSAVRYFSEKAETTSFALLQKATVKYQTAMKENAPEKAFEAVKTDFQLILDNYAGKMGGKLARLQFANICFQAGGYDTAIDLYDQSLAYFSDDSLYRTLILNNLGHAHAKMKNYQTAINYFEMILALEQSPLTDEALFNLGGLYANTGSSEKSVASYNRLLSDHTDSNYAGLVRELLNQRS